MATNALIQHRGALTGLISSDGFHDLLEIGRQKRPDLYDLQADKPPVLVERRLRREVPERLRHDGRVETVPDEAGVHNAVRVLRDAGVKEVAICFLYSFFDSAHEAAACRLFSSTIRPGQTRSISVFLLTTAPDASISAISTSKARPPAPLAGRRRGVRGDTAGPGNGRSRLLSAFPTQDP